MDGTCLSTGMVTRERSTCCSGGKRAQDLAEGGWSEEMDGGGVLTKFKMVGYEERMWKPSRRIHLSFESPG